MTIKVIIFLVVVAVTSIAKSAVVPLVSTDVAIQAQLADSDTAFIGYKIYQEIFKYSPAILIIFGLLLFMKEIKLLLGGRKSK